MPSGTSSFPEANSARSDSTQDTISAVNTVLDRYGIPPARHEELAGCLHAIGIADLVFARLTEEDSPSPLSGYGNDDAASQERTGKPLLLSRPANLPLLEDEEFISVGAGFGFKVSKKLYLQAKSDANATGLTHFIGVFDDCTEAVGTDRDAFLDLGAQAIAWVFPEREGGVL